ncbi:MAG TPA: hypothetical protein VGM56_10290 [Byssovorax sp.]|jgi:hypothetical protein
MLDLAARVRVSILVAVAVAGALAIVPGCVPMGGCADHRTAALDVTAPPVADCLAFATSGDVDTVDACGSSVLVTNRCDRTLTLGGEDNDGQTIAPAETATVYFDTFTGASSVTIPAELGATAIVIRIALGDER